MSDNSSSHKYTSAFTIVELIIVIVIIAILATVTIVAFTGIQKRAVASTLQDTLKKVATAMDTAAVDTSTYATLPTSITLAEGIGIALTEPVSPATTATTYCINATTQKYDDVTYYIEKGKSPEKGLCEGGILTTPGAVRGDYNYSAGGAEDLGYAPITIGSAHNDLYNFTVKTNIEWTQVTLSWDDQPGILRYELQTRNSLTGSWSSRLISNGSGSCGGSAGQTCSNRVAQDINSLIWTDTTNSVPSSAGKNYEYRIRTCLGINDNCGEWSTVSLANPLQSSSSMPAVAGFNISRSSDWSSVTLSWNTPPNYATDMSEATFELQTRNSLTGSWSSRLISNGSGSCGGSAGQTCSNVAPLGTTSLTWTDTTYAVPSSAGKTYEYRIRNCVVRSLYCGEWSTVSLTRP